MRGRLRAAPAAVPRGRAGDLGAGVGRRVAPLSGRLPGAQRRVSTGPGAVAGEVMRGVLESDVEGPVLSGPGLSLREKYRGFVDVDVYTPIPPTPPTDPRPSYLCLLSFPGGTGIRNAIPSPHTLKHKPLSPASPAPPCLACLLLASAPAPLPLAFLLSSLFLSPSPPSAPPIPPPAARGAQDKRMREARAP